MDGLDKSSISNVIKRTTEYMCAFDYNAIPDRHMVLGWLL